MENKELLDKILASLDGLGHISASDVPNIDLYMDQVTTFMSSRLGESVRYPETDKVMTKTMINNYAKNDLLPPPVKKKYSREHVLMLIFIYYYKGILSINDIHTLLEPITESFFGKDGDFGIEEIYEEVFGRKEEQMKRLKEDIAGKYADAMGSFEDAPEEDREFLKLFSFICSLSIDVYMKKKVIEDLIDDMRAHDEEPHGKKNEKKSEEK